MQVCKAGRLKQLDMLIYYGADVNAQNHNGNTPLHICAAEDQVETRTHSLLSITEVVGKMIIASDSKWCSNNDELWSWSCVNVMSLVFPDYTTWTLNLTLTLTVIRYFYITSSRWWCSSSRVVLGHRLHWIRVPQRIFQACRHGIPVRPWTWPQRLRSSSTSALDVPSTRLSTVGDRAFPVAAARTWNSLPAEVTDVIKFPAKLKTRLKSHLFLASFP